MKKGYQLLVCIAPAILIGIFYFCRIRFNMRDADTAGMLILACGAMLSIITPLIYLALRLLSPNSYRLDYCFLLVCISSVGFWVTAYLDYGDELHEFLAA